MAASAPAGNIGQFVFQNVVPLCTALGPTASASCWSSDFSAYSSVYCLPAPISARCIWVACGIFFFIQMADKSISALETCNFIGYKECFCLFVCFYFFFFPLDFFHSISLKITFWSSLRLMQIENELQGIVQNMQRQERVRTSHCSDMRSFRSKHKKIHVIFTLLSWRRWLACT